MKTKQLSIIIFVVLTLLFIALMLNQQHLPEHFDWSRFVLIIPLAYFLISIFSKPAHEKNLQKVAAISLGVVISALMSTEFDFALFLKQLLAIVVGAVITFYSAKLIAKRSH